MLSGARREPRRLFIGIDASLAGLIDASTKAARRPERGGALNALFVRAPVEDLPTELACCADRVTIILPWGSLLRAVIAPDEVLLAGIRKLCRPDATLEAVISIDPVRDALELLRLGIGGEPSLTGVRRAYAEAVFELRSLETMTSAELAAVGSTWAKRIATNPGRRSWRTSATAKPARLK